GVSPPSNSARSASRSRDAASFVRNSSACVASAWAGAACGRRRRHARRRHGGLRRARWCAPPEQCAQPHGAGQDCKQALHAGDATLPPLLATPVAPVPEAAQGGAADSVHEKEEFGLLNDYEIMLLLDPELTEERGSEIIK